MVYIIEQKLAALVNQYRVFAADSNGQKNDVIAFAQQKRFAFKEQFNFYTDETREEVAFSVKAEKALDVHGKLTVLDKQEQPIGSIRKNFGSSLLRSTWEIHQGNQPYLIIAERSLPIALLRRLWTLIPVAGELPFVLRFHFDLRLADSRQTVGTYNKLTLLRDHYQLTVEDQIVEAVGWQTLIAQAVMLDALQSR